MANIIQIKPLIRNFIVEHIDSSLKNNVYWLGERVNIPTYPYCVLTVVSENKDKRTSTSQGKYYYEQRPIVTTLYKTALITLSFYSAWVKNTYDVGDADTNKEFIYSQTNNMEELFETEEVRQYFYPNFSIQNVSSIRPLHETVDGGYEYRFEFDLTIGYDESRKDYAQIGRSVEVDIARNKTDHTIHFEIELDE